MQDKMRCRFLQKLPIEIVHESAVSPNAVIAAIVDTRYPGGEAIRKDRPPVEGP